MPRWLMLEVGPVDLLRGEVQRDGAVVRLTDKERALLAHLARQPGALVSRDALLAEVWQHPPHSLSRAVDKTMNRLRRKVERDPARPLHLHTVYGEGYRFEGLSEGPAAPGELDGAAAPDAHAAPPPDLDPLVGRQPLLERLEGAMQQARLVSLHGPGGIGKSRLARHVARSAAWPVTWLDCGSMQGVDDLSASLARQRGVRLQEPGPLPLARALAHAGPLLLVLDGVEHLTDDLGPQLTAWLGAAPRLRVLVTTRRRLGVAGERLLPVPPLDPDEARALFAARSPDPDLGPDDALLDLLSGSPLAIEVAAARVAVLDPAGALDPTALLDLDGPARAQRSLRAVLRGSWRLLSEAQRRDLVAVSAAPAPVDPRAAAALLQAASGEEAGPIPRRLAALHDHALLRASPGPRLHLDPLVAAFAAEKAADHPTLHRARARAEVAHAQHFIDQGERAVAEGARAESPALLRSLDAEQAHVTAILHRFTDRRPSLAARAALLLHPASVLLAPTPAVARQVALAVAQAEQTADPSLLARALCWQVRVLHGRRDHAGVCATLARLQGLTAADPLFRAQAHRLAAISAARAGDPAEVTTLLAQARALLPTAGAAAATEALWLRDAAAFAEQLSGGPGAAEPALSALVRDARAHGDRVVLAMVLVHHAIALARSRRHAAARDRYADAIACSAWLGAPGVAAIQRGNAAVNLQMMGAMDEAEPALRRAIGALERAGLESHTLAPRINLGNLMRDDGRLEAADAHYQAAVSGARRWERDQVLAYALSEHGQLQWMRGHAREADALLREACDRVEQVPGPPGLPAVMRLQRAAFLADQGRLDEATALAEAATPEAPATPTGDVARATAQGWLMLAAARRGGPPTHAGVQAFIDALPTPPDDLRCWLNHLRAAAAKA